MVLWNSAPGITKLLIASAALASVPANGTLGDKMGFLINQLNGSIKSINTIITVSEPTKTISAPNEQLKPINL
jgi:hypothetical protein